MANYKFAGSGTICGHTYLKKLRKVDDDRSGTKIDMSGGGDDEKEFDIGQKDRGITVEVLGDAPDVGDSGAVNINWGNGSPPAVMASAIVEKVKQSGSVGTAIVYTVTVCKKAA